MVISNNFLPPWITQAIPSAKESNDIRSIFGLSSVLVGVATRGIPACSGSNDGDPAKNAKSQLSPAQTVFPADWVDVDTWRGDSKGEGSRFNI